jgi:hypothetical protein
MYVTTVNISKEASSISIILPVIFMVLFIDGILLCKFLLMRLLYHIFMNESIFFSTALPTEYAEKRLDEGFVSGYNIFKSGQFYAIFRKKRMV